MRSPCQLRFLYPVTLSKRVKAKMRFTTLPAGVDVHAVVAESLTAAPARSVTASDYVIYTLTTTAICYR